MGLITNIASKGLSILSGGGMDVISGLGKWASAGDIGREKKKLLESRANYNRSQIEKAYAENYAKNMSQYANSLSSILSDKSTALSDINVASANVGDVDIQESSFRTTALAQLNNEFNSAMNILNNNLMNERLSMAQEKNNQIMETNISLYQAKQAVNAETDAMKREAISDTINGLIGIADTIITNKAKDKKSLNEAEEEIQKASDEVGHLVKPYSKQDSQFKALTENIKKSGKFNYSFGVDNWNSYNQDKYGWGL